MTTWHRRDLATTIDLIWASATLHAKTITSPELAGSDHYPQAIEVLAPLDTLEFEARHLPMPGMFSSASELDDYCSQLTSSIQHLIDTLILKSRGGPPRNLWWNQETYKAYEDLKHAERTLSQEQSEAAESAIRQAKTTHRV